MTRRACMLCLEKAGMTEGQIAAHLGGDLLDQLMPSALAARALGAPFLGLYGACSTAIEGLLIGCALVDAGHRENAICCASSHFCTAERQFRFPLELGTQRPPSAQWTATAAGAMLVKPGKQASSGSIRVTHATIGRIVDFEIKDANHMGAAMAPAVADTLASHFRDTGRDPSDYDLIATGDLGSIGRKLLLVLMKERGLEIPGDRLYDCGDNLYSPQQDCHAGGSGCGCIASVLTGHVMRRMEEGELRRVLALGSGAMLSPTSSQQGLTIPSISHAASLEVDG